jgi:hypothetical protein
MCGHITHVNPWCHILVPGLWLILGFTSCPRKWLVSNQVFSLRVSPSQSPSNKAEIMYDLCSGHVQCIHKRNSPTLKRLFSLNVVVIDIYGNAPHSQQWSIDWLRIWTKGPNTKKRPKALTSLGVLYGNLTKNWKMPFYLGIYDPCLDKFRKIFWGRV